MNGVAVKMAVHVAGIVAGFAVAAVALILAITYMRIALFVWAAVFLGAAIVGLVSGAKASPGGKFKGPEVKAKYKQVPPWAMGVVAGLFVLGVIATIIWPPFVG